MPLAFRGNFWDGSSGWLLDAGTRNKFRPAVFSPLGVHALALIILGPRLTAGANLRTSYQMEPVRMERAGTPLVFV